jgi:uncharacterized protein YbjT (DUF2867 family)
MAARRLVLVTGVTGYVGGRLWRTLEEQRYPLRLMARRPERLRGRAAPSTEIVSGDVLDPASLASALAGIDTAIYLIHSMSAGARFAEMDRAGARNFGDAARRAGLRRIVYLGGLGSAGVRLSTHLRSRQEVGEILRASGTPVIELRASIVLGSGSLSFEMIRALVERLPLMVTPRWVSVKAQPIAINDLLAYLVAAVDLPVEGNAVFAVGGADRVSFGDIMREYARQRGLRRVMIPVPLLTPRLSSLWLGLVTPLYARVGRLLIDGLRSPTVVEDDRALRAFRVRPVGLREAIALALRREDREAAETRWSDAGPHPGRPGARFGSRIAVSRTIECRAAPERTFAVLERLGGRSGWLYANWIWRLRGILDLLVGGVGLRRGRSLPDRLRVGDTVDWWRVESVEPNRRVRLLAEMKLPGRAWLEFEITPREAGCTLRQTAIFDPIGLGGLLYWYAALPFHRWVFRGMLRAIARSAAAPRGR